MGAGDSTINPMPRQPFDQAKGSSARSVPAALSTSEPEVQDLYQALVLFCHDVGPYSVEEKKTSIHLVRKSAFAGVHPRRKHLVLTVKAASAINSDRIFTSEQVSKSRWHHEIRLTGPTDLDQELLGWLRQAYGISA